MTLLLLQMAIILLVTVTFDSLSTIGLILFLFLVGMDLDYGQLYKHRRTALLASAMSILEERGLQESRRRAAPHNSPATIIDSPLCCSQVAI